MFQYYNHLGFNNPYYFSSNGTFIVKRNLPELLKQYTGELRIDPVAVIELLNKNYIFADRTLIQGIQRTPWLARPNELLNKWQYDKAPRHGMLDISEEEVAKTLFQKICNEIQLAIGDKRKIGLLLSGGMDSRMVAGALDFLIKTGILTNIEVTGITWGDEGTRDIVYAKEIVTRLNWKWKDYKVTANDLLNNIREAAIHGCEYSPLHLHAIPQIRDNNNLDIILAGSYGDSVGRAEYSRKRVKNLKPLLKRISNTGGMVHQSLLNHSIRNIENDIEMYHMQFTEKESYMQNELDLQSHYMRRMLNPCMQLLTDKMDFYQVFTHPDVYGYMWSINPERRNDLVYKYMLQEFSTRLDDIPWARTGLPYGHEKGTPDLFLKENNSYDKIILKELFKELETRIFSDEIKRLNIFNEKAIKTLKMLVSYSLKSDYDYLGRIIWLASLAEMIRIYNIQGLDMEKTYQSESGYKLLSVLIEYIISQFKIIASYYFKK
jgi:hypothetical protein